MKTFYQTTIKNYRLLLLSLLMISISSCSSFKNSSYDDHDGIYSSSNSTRETTLDENQTYTQTRQSSVYADKFRDMQEEFEETEYFTDVDAYTSNETDTVYVIERSYAGWGNNSNEINVNYYNTGWNNWGWGWNSWYGPGWNNGFYYGNTWGIGLNYGWNYWGWNNWYNPYFYGYGWNNYWGWNNWYSPYYAGYYNNHVAYNGGRRGSVYTGNSGRSAGRTATVTGRNSQIGNATVRSTRSRSSEIRSNNSTRTRNTTTNPRTYTTPRSTTSPRNTTTPRSTTTPRNYSTPRSSSSGSSYGGGRSSGGFSSGSSGGGRSSGGGGRGGRG